MMGFPGRPDRHPIAVGTILVVVLALLCAVWPERMGGVALLMRRTVGGFAIVAGVSVVWALYGLGERVTVWLRQRNRESVLGIVVWVLYAVLPSAGAVVITAFFASIWRMLS